MSQESAWAQTLREMLGRAEEQARTSAAALARYPGNKGAITGAAELDRQRVAALTAAIAALEALGRQGVIVAVDITLDGGYTGTNHPVDAAPSETAKDERIRELTAAIQHIHNLAHGVMTCPPLMRDGLRDIATTAREMLYPHQSWCRTEHEGACTPESIDEVAAASEDE